MVIFRAMQAHDLPGLYVLLHKPEVGITTLPHQKQDIRARLEQSLHCFKHPDPKNPCYYWFVLEDLEAHRYLGVSALATQVGKHGSFYAYKRIPYQTHSEDPCITHHDERLELNTDLVGSTELCTLFLHPNAREKGLGQLLSRGRLLFLGQFPSYFSSKIIAELRGVSNATGYAPFWEAIGKHFFHMSFKKADQLSFQTDKHFIQDLMPTSPMYVSMLSQEARAVIGQPHPDTQAAMNILLKEGFHGKTYIDIFDAGPIMENTCEQVKTIQTMQKRPVKRVTTLKGRLALISNTQFAGFRATCAPVQCHEDQLMLTQETAHALDLCDEDAAQFVFLGK